VLGVHHLEVADDAVLAVTSLDHEAQELLAAQGQGELLVPAHMGRTGDAVRGLVRLQLGAVLGGEVPAGSLWSTLGVSVNTDGQAGRNYKQAEHIWWKKSKKKYKTLLNSL